MGLANPLLSEYDKTMPRKTFYFHSSADPTSKYKKEPANASSYSIQSSTKKSVRPVRIQNRLNTHTIQQSSVVLIPRENQILQKESYGKMQQRKNSLSYQPFRRELSALCNHVRTISRRGKKSSVYPLTGTERRNVTKRNSSDTWSRSQRKKEI